MEVQVFDPAMCCSTGVCGPQVDPALARFASDLDWLGSHGVKVTRFNLSQEPGVFVSTAAVGDLLKSSGEAALPVVMVDGEVRSSGRYPSRSEMAEWASVPATAADVTVPVAQPESAQACCGGESAARAGCC
jgi:hypothetical protein